MILFITPSARAQECEKALSEVTGNGVQIANTLRQGCNRLRSGEYEAVVIDQLLAEAEPDECELLLQHVETAVPVFVNLAISGIPRLVREVRLALCRRKREEQVARKVAEQNLRNEFKGTLTALLLSCEMALAVPNLPGTAAQKIQAVYDLGRDMRTRLGLRSEASVVSTAQ